MWMSAHGGVLKGQMGVRSSRSTVTVVRSRLLWILVTALDLLEEHKVSLTAELHL